MPMENRLDWPKGPMKLWGSALFRSGRVLWALEELADLGTKMEYTHMDVPSRGPETHGNAEFMALNPAGKIPVLIDGDFVINESAAIMNYIADKAAVPLCGASGAE